MTDRSIVSEGERGHRRGIVLGFTMAELMLLLLFCLLLVSAGIVLKKDKEIDELKLAKASDVSVEDMTTLQSDSARLAQLLTLLFPSGVPKLTQAKIDQLWRELALSKRAGDALATSGNEINPDELAVLVEAKDALAEVAGDDLDQLKTLISELTFLREAKVEPDQLKAILAANASGPDSLGHDWPPIITLNDDGYWFARGSADITPEFGQQLQNKVADNVAELLKTYDVDVIEIIGHTDEQKITPSRPSNLDDAAISAMWGRLPSNDLVPVDNAGLGLARAIAVANVLRTSGKLEGAKIVPMSAAQLVLPGDILSDGTHLGDDKGRRRIEIRVRRTTANKE